MPDGENAQKVWNKCSLFHPACFLGLEYFHPLCLFDSARLLIFWEKSTMHFYLKKNTHLFQKKNHYHSLLCNFFSDHYLNLYGPIVVQGENTKKDLNNMDLDHTVQQPSAPLIDPPPLPPRSPMTESATGINRRMLGRISFHR